MLPASGGQRCSTRSGIRLLEPLEQLEQRPEGVNHGPQGLGQPDGRVGAEAAFAHHKRDTSGARPVRPGQAMDQHVPTCFEVLCYPGVAALLEELGHVRVRIHMFPPSTDRESFIFKARITLKKVARRQFLAVDYSINVPGF